MRTDIKIGDKVKLTERSVRAGRTGYVAHVSDRSIDVLFDDDTLKQIWSTYNDSNYIIRIGERSIEDQINDIEL